MLALSVTPATDVFEMVRPWKSARTMVPPRPMVCPLVPLKNTVYVCGNQNPLTSQLPLTLMLPVSVTPPALVLARVRWWKLELPVVQVRLWARLPLNKLPKPQPQ